MPTTATPDTEIRDAVKALEQALYNHERWAEAINATLICRLTPDERDLGADAPRLCRFGQWLYSHGLKSFGDHPGFTQIETEHERMHKAASLLLYASSAGDSIPVPSYERFINAMQRLRLEIATLKRELEETLYNLDPLTGTPSRVGMLTKLREEQARVRRDVHPCTLAMMDIDHFKAVNDTYGHMAGDNVLIALARHAMQHLRPYDSVFRYGGEEFLICMPDADLEMGREILERLRAQIGALDHASDSRRFRVTASFGLAPLDPVDPVELSIDRADRALYAAKAAGRNCTAVWDGSMMTAAPLA